MLKKLTNSEVAKLRAYLKPRVIDPDLCDGTLKHTRKWLKDRKLPSEDVISWLQPQDVHCDCEVWHNIRKYRAHVLKPDEVGAMHLAAIKPSDPDWHALAKAIRERDHYKCALGWRKRPHEARDVHHINWRKDDNRWENLITLCSSCHGKIHGRTGESRKYFEKRLSCIARERTGAVGAGGGR